MKEFTFPVVCSFGKGDSGDTYVTVELTDEEADRIIQYCAQPDNYYSDFSDSEELADLYHKIYELGVDQCTDELRENGDWLDEEDIEDPDWRADDLYSIWVNFPEEITEMWDKGGEG